MQKTLQSLIFIAFLGVSVGLPLYLLSELSQVGNALDKVSNLQGQVEGVKTDLLEQTEELNKLQGEFNRLKDRIIGSPLGNTPN